MNAPVAVVVGNLRLGVEHGVVGVLVANADGRLTAQREGRRHGVGAGVGGGGLRDREGTAVGGAREGAIVAIWAISATTVNASDE